MDHEILLIDSSQCQHFFFIFLSTFFCASYIFLLQHGAALCLTEEMETAARHRAADAVLEEPSHVSHTKRGTEMFVLKKQVRAEIMRDFFTWLKNESPNITFIEITLKKTIYIHPTGQMQ